MLRQSKVRNVFTTSHQQAGVQPLPQSVQELLSEINAITTNALTSFSFLSAVMTEHIIQYGTSLWSARVRCLGCVPSQPLAHPLPSGLFFWQGHGEKTLTLCKHCLPRTKTLVCYHWFVIKTVCSKMQTPALYGQLQRKLTAFRQMQYTSCRKTQLNVRRLLQKSKHTWGTSSVR